MSTKDTYKIRSVAIIEIEKYVYRGILHQDYILNITRKLFFDES